MKGLRFFLFLTLLVLLLVEGSSQEPGQIIIGQGPVTVTFLEDSPDIPAIRTLLSRAMTRTGVAYADHSGPQFLVHTLISEVYLKDIDINGQPMIAAELTVSFSIQDRKGELTFGSVSIPVRESGETKQVLLRQAARQLQNKSREIEELIREARSNITTYYQEHCDEVLNLARRYLSMEQEEECLRLTGQIPSGVPCFEEASALMTKAWSARLERQCATWVKEARILADQGAYDAAYEKAMLLPANSQCREEVQVVLDFIAHEACEKYLLQAESFFARKDLDRCVDALASLETVSEDCARRKARLEKQMTAQLDEASRRQWAFRQQQYQDQIALQQAEMDRADRRLDMEGRQAAYDQDFRMKKLDTDAEVRAKELAIAPELEKYRSRVAIARSRDTSQLEMTRVRETRKAYQSLFQTVSQVHGGH
ncbi:MAG: hypothetical protein H6546_03955 [Chitinophagales bacterium]|nr:hypothetical protein [Saprospiraceae bacterium]MCB9019462.1 hypothetical protein [Chitinophagales bacterium]MCB9312608.1 hypothetical protein [Lewinellaceae bacterium]HRW74498.1 hypothetical protein [Saprospiraceae bacterium]